MKRILLSAIFLIANISVLFAQGPFGCNGGDIDSGDCPIDNWVIVFAALSVIVATAYLYKKQQKEIRARFLNN
ncbi:hypothetical protein ACFS5N_18140 [Mucilaginibacter ximonensis]|uniref:Uncharacterized protein n=1 Tax=Mucilaginibacter ximonensis TaxID=538021 RepID=A0ABW5YG95_9SPHI